MIAVRLVISTICALVAAAAHGQLLAERSEGTQRVCLYRDSVGALTSGVPREHRVGLGENCPLLPPNTLALPTPPPTARLASEAVVGTRRLCNYEEAGRQWQGNVAAERPCPVAAGMLAEEARPETRR